MGPEELKVAEEFVEELVALGVLRPPADEDGNPFDVVTNAPVLTVPKPGQPGQYRCIADKLKGGQNASVRNDQVFLPRAYLSWTSSTMGDGPQYLIFPSISTIFLPIQMTVPFSVCFTLAPMTS
jgi:hypothetical protein